MALFTSWVEKARGWMQIHVTVKVISAILGSCQGGSGGFDRRTKLGPPATSLTAPLSPRWALVQSPLALGLEADDDAATSADTIVIAAHDRQSPAPQIRKAVEKRRDSDLGNQVSNMQSPNY